MVPRIAATLVGIAVAYVVCFAGYAAFLLLRGQLGIIDRYYLYAWIGGGLGGLVSLAFCGWRPKVSYASLVLVIVLLALSVPFLRWYDVNDNLARVLRFIVFFAHLPLSAMSGLLAAMPVYQRLTSEVET